MSPDNKMENQSESGKIYCNKICSRSNNEAYTSASLAKAKG